MAEINVVRLADSLGIQAMGDPRSIVVIGLSNIGAVFSPISDPAS